jgi:hypothetical protein
MIRLWRAFRMWRYSGLGIMASVKQARRYLRRHGGRRL